MRAWPTNLPDLHVDEVTTVCAGWFPQLVRCLITQEQLGGHKLAGDYRHLLWNNQFSSHELFTILSLSHGLPSRLLFKQFKQHNRYSQLTYSIIQYYSLLHHGFCLCKLDHYKFMNWTWWIRYMWTVFGDLCTTTVMDKRRHILYQRLVQLFTRWKKFIRCFQGRAKTLYHLIIIWDIYHNNTQYTRRHHMFLVSAHVHVVLFFCKVCLIQHVIYFSFHLHCRWCGLCENEWPPHINCLLDTDDNDLKQGWYAGSCGDIYAASIPIPSPVRSIHYSIGRASWGAGNHVRIND